MEEEKKGITMKDICKTIWLKKWIALIVAVAVALACAVLLNYAYNPRVRTYEIEFSLNLPGSENSSFYSYPDGKLFYYSDLTSAKTLNEIKENGNFSNVDVDKIVKNGDIGISRELTVTPLSSDGSVSYREAVYKVSTKAKYFGGIKEAKEFLTAVAEYPAEYLENMEINYDVYLPLVKVALENDNRDTAVKYLDEQLKFLSAEYKKLTDTYGETFVVSSGKTLLACAQELGAYEVDAADVEASVTAVEGFINSFRTTCKAVYAKAASVAFIRPSIVVEYGGMSLVKILLLSVIVGVVIALVAAYVAGYLSLKKKKAVAEAPSEEAPQTQPEKENQE